MTIFAAAGVRDERTDVIFFSWEKGQTIKMLTFQSIEPENSEVTLSPAPNLSSAVVCGKQIMNVALDLPFKSERQVNILVPSQLEEILPFESDEFTVTSTILGAGKSDGSNVLATLIHSEEIVSALSRCKVMALDPHQLTTFGGAVAAFAECHAERSDADTFRSYIFQTGNSIAVCGVIGRKLIGLREWNINRVEPLEQLAADIASSISKWELDLKSPFNGYYFSGNPQLRTKLEGVLGSTPLELSLPSKVHIPDELFLPEVPWWAIGLAMLASGNVPERKKPVVDLRIGPFAYHRRFKELVTYLVDEAVYISVAVFFSASLLGATLYSSSKQVSDLRSRIKSMTQTALNQSSSDPQSNRSLLETNVSELEEQLKGIGSLGSTSPLAAIKEVIAATPGVDVALEGLTYSDSKLVLRGSVAENRMIGELSGALKARTAKFCEVFVNPRGRTSGGRIGFAAEITLCQ